MPPRAFIDSNRSRVGRSMSVLSAACSRASMGIGPWQSYVIQPVGESSTRSNRPFMFNGLLDASAEMENSSTSLLSVIMPVVLEMG